MKKFITIILIMLFALTALFCSSCKSPFLKDDLPPDDLSAVWSYRIIEKDGWYYPTAKGTVTSKYRIQSIKLYCLNETETLNITSTTKTEDGTYKVKFNSEILYGELRPGDYEAYINVTYYDNPASRRVNSSATLHVDELYRCISVVRDIDWEHGAVPGPGFSAMTKESQWAGPFFVYGANETPIMWFD